MYFSRGNPVIYYGDEQGFTGDGGDQLARQDMFPSRVDEYNDDDLIGTDATTAEANFDEDHPLYESIAGLAALTRRHPALRDGAHQHRYAGASAGIYAFSRIDRTEQREYVVALNNAETAQTAAIPTYAARASFSRVYGDGPRTARSDGSRRLTLTVPPLSAVVYALGGRIPRSDRAPSITLADPAPAPGARGRLAVRAEVGGSSFYEVTFLAKGKRGGWAPIGTDDTAPYRVFHDVSDLRAGTRLHYKAIVLDNRGHKRTSRMQDAAVPAPVLTWDAPAAGAKQRDRVLLRLFADPERATHVVTFERRVGTGAWTAIGRDDSSPAYSLTDSLAGLAPGTVVTYRATLTEPDGTRVTSAERAIEVAPPPLTTAVVHYLRPAGDYADWGLHLWGGAVVTETAWDAPLQRVGVDPDGWARYEIPLADDTQAVNFIMHRPSGDSVPETREPGGNRSFVPIDHPEIWLIQGDPTVYTSQPATG
jgi:hypothetical protein